MKNTFNAAANAFHAQESAFEAQPSGHMSYGLHPKTMKPTGLNTQTPAQHASVVKAAGVSAANRHSKAKGVLG